MLLGSIRDSADIVPVGVYAGAGGKLDEHSLVILSMDLPFWVIHGDDGYRLCVESPVAGRVESELAAYEEENRFWPPEPVAVRQYKTGVLAPWIYATVLVVAFLFQGRFHDVGRMDAIAFVEQRQWWRPMTALFMHADVEHLMGNLLAGAVYGVFVARHAGRWLGWILMLASGVAGNIITALVYYPEPHLSLGASTAVFGALGILVGLAVLSGVHGEGGMRRAAWLVPLGAGLAILSWTGAGSGNTDVAAHICGFASGIVLGIATAMIQENVSSTESAAA